MTIIVSIAILDLLERGISMAEKNIIAIIGAPGAQGGGLARQIRFFAAAVTAVITVAAALAGCTSVGRGKVVEDPEGRFTYQAAPELRPQLTDGTYDRYTLESPAMEAYVVAVEAPNEQAGRALAFDRIGKDFAALKLEGSASFGEWRADKFSTATEGEWAGIAYQYRAGTLYCMVVYGGGDSSADALPAPVTTIIGSFKFSQAAGKVFRPASFAELEGFIDSTAASVGGSISVAAVKNGKIVYRYAAGDPGEGIPASPDVAYHWGSITKIATATAVMQQVEQGRVDLDATLDTYFPEFPLGRKFTVRNLLTHSAGLPAFEVIQLVAFGENKMPDLASVLQTYWSRVKGLAYEPGSLSAYNNWNFLILGRLVEKVSGEELTSYVRRHIFAPVGMKGTAYTTAALAGAPEALGVVTLEQLATAESILTENGLKADSFAAYKTDKLAHLRRFDILPCWGGVKSPAADAALLGWMFLNDGEIAGNRVLARSTVREMLRMQKSRDGKPLGFGLAWFLGQQGRERIVEHGGGGPGIDSLLRIYPSRGLSIAVLGNAAGYGPGKVIEYTAALLTQKK
jgi:CubicO group peptidase (beta-lactamase class C family)